MRTNLIAITGASGYLGTRLLVELVRMGGRRIKVLTRSRYQNLVASFGASIEVVEGDLLAPDSLRSFLEPGCTVVNLAYLWDAGEAGNRAAISNLLEACKEANAGRLIHCSTADVAGRASDNPVTEKTTCRPVTEYSTTKYAVENTILDAVYNKFDVAILRPTAVFGSESKNLKILAENLVSGRRLRNYLKSSLFGRRRMNLVHVSNVVAALLFLMDYPGNLDGEAFIVSDDDSHSNNFSDVEEFLMRALGVPDYNLPRVPVSLCLLAFFLRCLGRNSINPRRNYASDKLIGLGFKRPVSFDAGLVEYATWYRSFHLEKQNRRAV